MKLQLITLAVASLVLGQAGCKSGSEQSQDNANSAAGAASSSAAGNGAGETAGQSMTREQTEARVLLDKGIELYKNDQDKEAVEAFQQAAQLDPDLAEAYFRLGLALGALGRKDEAEEAYQKAVEAYKKFTRQNPKDAKAHFNLGHKEAVKLEPDNAEMYYELGLAHNKVAQYQEAVTAFQKTLELEPDNYRAGEALEKAKIDLQRFQTMVKRQEELLKKQEAAKEKNANATPSPSPSPSVLPTPPTL
jgi:tetratricopeptide (TPR) repeat protein